MATIKFIKHHMRNPDTKTSLIEGSKDVFKDFTYVDYKNISKDDINYLPLHIRQPFDVEDLLIKQLSIGSVDPVKSEIKELKGGK